MVHILGLIEGANVNFHFPVLSKNSLRLLIGVERIHEYEWYVGVVRSIQILAKAKENASQAHKSNHRKTIYSITSL